MDLDAIVFNPISSTILKWLLFKPVSWGHDFQPWFGIVWWLGYYWDCMIVGLFWLHHIQSLANFTMATIAIGKEG
jgi:hypothetical protein